CKTLALLYPLIEWDRLRHISYSSFFGLFAMQDSNSQNQPSEQKQPSELKKQPFLADFPSIHSPSYNRDTNRTTFAYRLSELVFGSLLASYVLGFIAFASVYLQPATKFQVTPRNPNELMSKILGLEKLKDITALLSFETVDQSIHINLMLQTVFSWNIVLLFQQLFISLLFSAYTALLYVNFHQSILYLSTDHRKSSVDFMLAIAIGISFGLSMIFPLSTIFWLGLLTVGVFRRRRILLLEYSDYVAFKITEEAHIKLDSGSTPGDEKATRERVVGPIRKEVEEALRSSSHDVVKSWVSAARKVWWAVGFMIVIPLIPLALEIWSILSNLFSGKDLTGAVEYPSQEWLKTLVSVNTLFCFAASAFLLRRQYDATRDMPLQEERGDAILDEELNTLLKPIKERIVAKH
ncbi:MAG TPA: hypothetical protein VGO47_12020, partial [Chlamydiales bacterium]|nr:hypothetical protein [Chlamydiales bacterium]